MKLCYSTKSSILNFSW